MTLVKFGWWEGLKRSLRLRRSVGPANQWASVGSQCASPSARWRESIVPGTPVGVFLDKSVRGSFGTSGCLWVRRWTEEVKRTACLIQQRKGFSTRKKVSQLPAISNITVHGSPLPGTPFQQRWMRWRYMLKRITFVLFHSSLFILEPYFGLKITLASSRLMLG